MQLLGPRGVLRGAFADRQHVLVALHVRAHGGLHQAREPIARGACSECDVVTHELLARSAVASRPLSSARAKKLRQESNVHGLAILPEHGGFGTDAYVFADHARDLAADKEIQALLLGDLIAHELGHLLLGEAGHSALAGIMHGPWQKQEREQAK
jgi:hypothetical protein